MLDKLSRFCTCLFRLTTSSLNQFLRLLLLTKCWENPRNPRAKYTPVQYLWSWGDGWNVLPLFFPLYLGHAICDVQQPEILEANWITCACQNTAQHSVYTCHRNVIYIIKPIEASVHRQALISFPSRHGFPNEHDSKEGSSAEQESFATFYSTTFLFHSPQTLKQQRVQHTQTPKIAVHIWFNLKAFWDRILTL